MSSWDSAGFMVSVPTCGSVRIPKRRLTTEAMSGETKPTAANSAAPNGD